LVGSISAVAGGRPGAWDDEGDLAGADHAEAFAREAFELGGVVEGGDLRPERFVLSLELGGLALEVSDTSALVEVLACGDQRQEREERHGDEQRGRSTGETGSIAFERSSVRAHPPAFRSVAGPA